MKAWPPAGLFPSLLAHQGGWDEILLVGGPLVIVGFALWLANRRARAQVEGATEATTEADTARMAGPEPESDSATGAGPDLDR
jgi:hypothetical protein